MIAKDRELLARLAQVNRNVGAGVVELLHRQDGGELPADGLRALGDILATLGADLRARAEELECRVIEKSHGGHM